MTGSKIEWTDETWNPVVGCDHASEGCRNCYAETMSNRLASMDHSEQYDDVVDEEGRFAGGTVNTVPKMLEKPLEWDKPRRVFVNSMSDLFHPDVPFNFIDKVFAVMALEREHTFQVLTKRPGRMRDYLTGRDGNGRYHYANYSVLKWHEDVECIEDVYEFEGKNPDIHRNYFNDCPDWPLPNVWLGVSVEDQDAADKRIPPLLECPAEVRFLSCEPFLDEISLSRLDVSPMLRIDALNGRAVPLTDQPIVDTEGSIDWVIAGGESGPGARPMHPEWVRSLRDQCDEAGVPFFFKQWGAWEPGSYQQEGYQTKVILSNGETADYPNYQEEMEKFKSTEEWNNLNPQVISKVGKDEAGRELDGETHDEFPKEAN